MQYEYDKLSQARPIRIGVVGLGSQAQITHLPILSDMDDYEIAGVCDTEAYKVSRISEKYNVPGFVDSVNLIQKTEPDVVLICTPTITHLPISLNALSSGVHVIIEKPVARSYAEAVRLAEASQKHKKLALVAMNQRFRQDVSVLRNFLDAGELGDIWRVRSGWLKRKEAWDRSPWLHIPSISGGGVLMDLGIQLLDIVNWCNFRSKPKRVTAYTFSHVLNLEVEDSLTCAIEFENGLVFQLECSWGLLAEKNIAFTYVEGTKGTAKLDPLVVHKTIQGELVNVAPVKSASPIELYHASFKAQYHSFIQALRGQIEPVSTAQEAMEVMKIVDMIYQSAREGREIVPSET